MLCKLVKGTRLGYDQATGCLTANSTSQDNLDRLKVYLTEFKATEEAIATVAKKQEEDKLSEIKRQQDEKQNEKQKQLDDKQKQLLFGRAQRDKKKLKNYLKREKSPVRRKRQPTFSFFRAHLPSPCDPDAKQ